MRTGFIESKNEEDIHKKNQNKIKLLPSAVPSTEAASKSYVDNRSNNPSILRNTAHVEFNDKSLDKFRSLKYTTCCQRTSYYTETKSC